MAGPEGPAAPGREAPARLTGLHETSFCAEPSPPALAFTDLNQAEVAEPKEDVTAPTWTVNISARERVARIVIGALGAAVGAFLLTGAAGILAAALEVALVIAGLDLVVTGTLGHCPLYAKLGHVPASLKGRNP